MIVITKINYINHIYLISSHFQESIPWGIKNNY